MTSILNKIMDQIFREEMLSPEAIKIKNYKKDDFSGENYDRLSILIPNRILKIASRRKTVHTILSK